MDERYVCSTCGVIQSDGCHYDWDTDQYYCYACRPDDEGSGPYDDEGDLAYSERARGEEAAPAISPALDNPRYPAHGGQG